MNQQMNNQDNNVLDFFQGQIENINATELAEIIGLMPSDGTLKQRFTQLNEDQWVYRYQYRSISADFSAVGTGSSPREAFSVAKKIILKQIQEWHVARKDDQAYTSVAKAALAPEKVGSPTVLIVEDDPDIACATARVFDQLGCRTIVSDGSEGTSQKMSFQHLDFIVLDWMLADNIYGDQVIQSSIQTIEDFKDLKSYFEKKHPKVITYSALDRSKVHLPENKYFEHLDHWQKPVQYNDLATRASELLLANGF